MRLSTKLHANKWQKGYREHLPHTKIIWLHCPCRGKWRQGTEVIFLQLHLGCVPLLPKSPDHCFPPHFLFNLFGKSFMELPGVDAMAWGTELKKLFFDFFVLRFAGGSGSFFPAHNFLWLGVGISCFTQRPQLGSEAINFLDNLFDWVAPVIKVCLESWF